MNRQFSKMSVLPAIGAVVATTLVLGPSIGAAATATSAAVKPHAVKIVVAGKPAAGTNLKGGVSGSLGKGSMRGKLEIPKTRQTWTFKSGSLKVKTVGAVKGGTTTGAWKVTGGTGRFKRASGGGKFSGRLSTQKNVFKGRVKY